MAAGFDVIDWGLLNPAVRDHFLHFANDLSMDFAGRKAPCLFRAFCGYRSPKDQAKEVAAKVSKATPWRSAHQYGLAVDFVPFINGRWTWSPPEGCWDYLRTAAASHGLQNDIEWDRPHVQHPLFDGVMHLLFAGA